jgi:hypothetical protein
MRTDTTHRLSLRKGAIAFAATIVAVATAGCGSAESPPAVRVALSAPTDGSAVTVRNIKVFGTVDPPSAAVTVAGAQAHVAHGVFGRWIALRTGLSHIKIVASAAGYVPSRLNIVVRSSPGPPPQTSGSEGEPSANGTSAPPTDGGPYAARIRATVLRACEATAGSTATAATSCECFLSQLEAHVSQSRLAVWERAFLRGEATLPRWLRNAALACRKT